jgi:hypothetical protein
LRQRGAASILYYFREEEEVRSKFVVRLFMDLAGDHLLAVIHCRCRCNVSK